MDKSIDGKIKFNDFLEIVKEVIADKKDLVSAPSNEHILTSDLEIDSLDIHEII
jgi:hypothetical protein